MKIGITERGDAGLDLGWIQEIADCDGAILITKNLTEEFVSAAIEHKDKVILHACCTGYSGTFAEPKVPCSYKLRDAVLALIRRGFPKEQVVIRVDPIIPTQLGIATAWAVVETFIHTGIDFRYRVSVLDGYPHVHARFQHKGCQLPFDGFQATDAQFDAVNALIRRLRETHGIECECCAEPKLTECVQCGCISQKDLKILGLGRLDDTGKGKQRQHCLCPTCKTEMLTQKTPCMNGCMYCYWKKDGE